jgi:uncharacterized protein YehS (DUF1456 family)
MIGNDVLRSVRYLLDLSDAAVIETIRLADPDAAVERTDVQAWLQKEGEDGFVACPDPMLARFLDGLIVHYRGRDDSRPPRPIPARLSNNEVLKKLRVAFSLQDVDMHAVFESAGFPVSKPELSALFRMPGHKNYRPCGDQMLRNFLKGLAIRVRGTR